MVPSENWTEQKYKVINESLGILVSGIASTFENNDIHYINNNTQQMIPKI